MIIEDLMNLHMSYLLYAGERGRKYLEFEAGSNRAGEQRARASQLFRCSAATINKRLGIPMSNPYLQPEYSYSTQLLFRNGYEMEAIWCEALVYAGVPCELQVPLENKWLVGKCDAIVRHNHILEFKGTQVMRPSMTNMGQLAAYMWMADISHGTLVLQHIGATDFWQAEQLDEGYVFHKGSEEYTILHSDLQEEVARHNMKADVTPRFILGECTSKPAHNKKCRAGENETVSARCPWFGRCWSTQEDIVLVSADENGEPILIGEL